MTCVVSRLGTTVVGHQLDHSLQCTKLRGSLGLRALGFYWLWFILQVLRHDLDGLDVVDRTLINRVYSCCDFLGDGWINNLFLKPMPEGMSTYQVGKESREKRDSTQWPLGRYTSHWTRQVPIESWLHGQGLKGLVFFFQWILLDDIRWNPI